MNEPQNVGGRPTSHGGYARTIRDERTAALRQGYVDLLVDELGDEVTGAEAAAVGIGADALTRLHDVNAWLDGRDVVDTKGNPLPVMQLYVALVNAAGRAIERVATLAALRRQRGKKGPTLSEYLANSAAAAPVDESDAEHAETPGEPTDAQNGPEEAEGASE